ncbi:MAG TPA: hypothetical protein PKB13_05340 [Clostridia bacterium]|nr:hypothetical protein [Clostridia bacterium]
MARPWTEAENEQLMDKWGQVSIPRLAKNFGRSVNAIKIRAQRLGLGAVLMAGEYVTLNQLIKAVYGDTGSYSYKIKSWCENRGLPVHTKRVDKCSFRVVYLGEFWKWAEQNKSFLDFSKMEPHALGEEPAWVADQRKRDFHSCALQRKDPWTPLEDQELIRLLKQHRYGYAELSKMLHRSAGAIQRRCTDLKLKERPVKADNRDEWTEEDFRIVADGIRAGDSYTVIGEAVGRSEKAVRGKLYYTYLTENADKIREMMGNGPYGTGAPEPTVKQGIHLSRCRTETLGALSSLVAALRFRMNDLGYEPYWQRFMCMKWHDVKGCSAGCENCDECTQFERIKPQCCVRCGAEFLLRKKSIHCPRCLTQRKKQHQRVWAATHSNRKTALEKVSN